jgi:hypothetical protein
MLCAAARNNDFLTPHETARARRLGFNLADRGTLHLGRKRYGAPVEMKDSGGGHQ